MVTGPKIWLQPVPTKRFTWCLKGSRSILRVLSGSYSDIKNTLCPTVLARTPRTHYVLARTPRTISMF